MKTPILFGTFIFIDVTDKAKEIFNSGLFPLYELHIEEQSESLIEDYEDLNKALENGSTIGIEGGYLNLHIGIENGNEKTLISFQEDGLLVESTDDPDSHEAWVNGRKGWNVSWSDTMVFDSQNSLIIKEDKEF